MWGGDRRRWTTGAGAVPRGLKCIDAQSLLIFPTPIGPGCEAGPCSEAASSEAGQAGVGQDLAPSTPEGCRGVNGPVPQPLSIRANELTALYQAPGRGATSFIDTS